MPKHAGADPSVSAVLSAAITQQYEQHPTWSSQLHYDNLLTLAREDASLGAVPSYPTVRRYRAQRDGRQVGSPPQAGPI